MTSFTDSQGFVWSMNIKFRDVERVKNNVKGINGQPVDLLAIAERGDFSTISGSVQTVLNVVFWLCLDEILQNFDLEEWNYRHEKLYEYLPNEKGRSVLQKAADWFGERITGNELPEVVRAWERALLNFIPNPKIRESVENLIEKQEVLQNAIWEEAEGRAMKEIESSLEQLAEKSGNLPES